MRIVMKRSGYLTVTILFLTAVSSSQAKYSGGSGTAQDPYQIATAADLIALGETPANYDKHFVLTADIDLDPNLPGRKVFDKAVIAANPPWEGATPFTGVFDGNRHTISRLTIRGASHDLGLFGILEPGADVRNLGLVGVNMISSTDSSVGGLVGSNRGCVTGCYCTGAVSGRGYSVGGLVGHNYRGSVADCYSAGTVSGGDRVGGLVGLSESGAVTRCYSTGAVRGTDSVGGLVGDNAGGQVTQCYSTGPVAGTRRVGRAQRRACDLLLQHRRCQRPSFWYRRAGGGRR